MINNKRITVRLADGYVLKISKRARKEKVTLSEIVRRIINQYFK